MCKPKILMATLAAAALLTPLLSQATPYASCITNNGSGNITFYLNENGGDVTVTYEDGTTNANYDGITTGTNLIAGQHSFALGSHTSYTISVAKVGSGVPGLVENPTQTNTADYYGGNPNIFVLGNLRGVDVNKNPTSPNFGRVYIDRYSPGLIYRLNSDGSLVNSSNATVLLPSTASSPYRLQIAGDDYLSVADLSSANASIWRIAPDLSTGRLLLGPVGDAAGMTAGVHGEISSPPLLIGSLTNAGGATLMQVDGDFPSSLANALLIYTNVTLAALPYTNAPIVGPGIGLNIQYLGNVYPGLTCGPNGYIYTSEQRANYAIPDMYVLDATGTNVLWTSQPSAGVAPDYFVTDTGDGIPNAGLVDSAVSPDGKYLVGLAIDNHFTICPLTNGIPDVSKIFTVVPTSYAENARGICWDAADNLYNISSGTACVQEWTLGLTVTAVTTGNANGLTGFTMVYPATTVSVSAADALISQANTYGNPTNSYFTISRTGDTSGSMRVSFTLGGTATNGTYTIGTSGSIDFAAGQTSTNISIAAVTDGIARPTTTVSLTVKQTAIYVANPSTATINLLNTAPDQLVASVNEPSMYNAFSNDDASLTITRLGDTNAATFTASSFTFAGTAIEGTDYTMPTSVTFNPGDLTQVSYIYPLINGQPPVHTNNMVYTGNKTAIIAVGSGSGYTPVTNAATLTIIDSANPPATVLFSDALTNSDDATNWNITAGNGDTPNSGIDNTINFGYDLQNGDIYAPIPLPPNGATTALRVTCNKNSVGNAPSAGVNLYLTNAVFSGDYAVRFNMNITEGSSSANTTEGALFGINHNGTETNWWTGSGLYAGATTRVWASDGIWYWISADGGAGAGDYISFSGTGGKLPNTGWQYLANLYQASFTNAFKTNVFTSDGGPGLVANFSPYEYGNDSSWADVEIKQVKNIVTLSIDKTPIYTYTNTTAFTNGVLMLGYDDPFNASGGVDGAVYFSNLRVVRIAPSGPPTIGEATVNNANSTFVMDFTCTDSSLTTSSFTVQSSATVNGTYTDVAGATITQLGSNAFQAVVPVSGSIQFYRIKQQ